MVSILTGTCACEELVLDFHLLEPGYSPRFFYNSIFIVYIEPTHPVEA